MTELNQISYAEIREFTHEYRQLIYEMPFQIPQDLIFLGRAVGILSGLATGLDPDFNVWHHAIPYAQKMIASDIKSTGGTLLDELSIFLRDIFHLPRKLTATLSKMETGDIPVKNPDLSQRVSRLEKMMKSNALAIISIGLLLSGIQLYQGEMIVMGWLLIGLAFTMILWLIVSLRR